MKILAENTRPFCLSGQECRLELPLNEEHEGEIMSGDKTPTSWSLHLRGIFGTSNCPCYDIFLLDQEPIILLGILSCFGCRSKSASNPDGGNLAFRLNTETRHIATHTLETTKSLHLLFIAQEVAPPDLAISVEFIYLCSNDSA
ncbi:MAG: hypothetical protein RIQ83_521 [Pseudomonadota bacterium]